MPSFVPSEFPDCVEHALHQAPDTAKANLAVHIYQVAYSAALQEGAASLALRVGEVDCFQWKWLAESNSELEMYARNVYCWGVAKSLNHATVHTAIAGLAMLGALMGEKWDCEVFPYTVYL